MPSNKEETAAYIHLPHLLFVHASIKHACAPGANKRIHYLDLAWTVISKVQLLVNKRDVVLV